MTCDAPRRKTNPGTVDFSAQIELLEAIFEGIPVGVQVWEGDGTLFRANAAVTTVTGYAPDEIPDIDTWFSLVYPDATYRDQIRKAWYTDRGRKSGTAEFRITHKDGTTREIEFHTVFLLGERAIVTLSDITDRKSAEEELSRYAALQKRLIEISLSYLGVTVEEVSRWIADSLRTLGEATGAGRVFIFRYDFENDLAKNTYEWCAAGVKPRIEELQALPLEEIRTGVETNCRGKPYIVENVKRLDDERMRKVLQPQGIKSLLTVPIIVAGECSGFFTNRSR